jgi:hypothetical protein
VRSDHVRTRARRAWVVGFHLAGWLCLAAPAGAQDDREIDERLSRVEASANRLSGYLDFGFFRVQGNGSGLRTDTGHRHFPEYMGVVPDSWVFLGDPLATMINARGEPADTFESRAITFNPVRAGNRPTFMVNSLSLALFAAASESLTVTGAVDFLPRSRDVSDPAGQGLGDFLDVKLAYAEYLAPLSRFSLHLFLGKIDSVLGIEYRSQDAPDRLAVTPSLICRYTCGRPLGFKARAGFFEEALTLALTLSNGTHMVEMFPFVNEVDANAGKTLAARLAYRLPLGAGLEGGVSGAAGAQDNQSRNDVRQWHVGFDLALDWKDLIVMAEFVQGRAPGAAAPGEIACGLAPCLRYKGAYGQLAYRLSNLITPYLRTDWRKAVHRSGASFAYQSDLMRFTGGLRLEIGASAIVKAEYTHVRELGRVPSFPDDVFSSALVLKY